MAEGGPLYNLRDSTKEVRSETDRMEEERMRRRLSELEERKRKELELKQFTEQREKLIIERTEAHMDNHIYEPEFRSIDNLDLSAETRLLDHKLDTLKESEHEHMHRGSLLRSLEKEPQQGYVTSNATPKSFLNECAQGIESRRQGSDSSLAKLNESIRKLEMDVYSKDQTIGCMKTEQEKDMYRASTPTVASKAFTSERYFDKLQTLENELQSKFSKLDIWSEKLSKQEVQLQRKERLFDDMMRSFKERENQLMEQEKLAVQERIVQKREIEELEMKILRQELALREDRTYERPSIESEYDVGRGELKENRFDRQNELGRSEINGGAALNTVDHMNLNVKLNLASFSGKEPVPKNESSFEEFKLEFESVRQIYSEQVLKQTLRKTLKEQARKTMLHLGTKATVNDIMKSLEENFGNVASEDSILSRFLLAEQKQDESIVEWGLRLEDILLQVCHKSKMDETEKRLKLKNRFWRGLRSDELRQSTRAHFDSSMSYEELKNKVRSEEYEIRLMKERTGVRSKTGKVNVTSAEIQTKETNDLISNLMKKIENLDRKFEDMKKAQIGPDIDRTYENRQDQGRYRGAKSRGRGRGGYSRGRGEVGQNNQEFENKVIDDQKNLNQ
ncbi:uncharacterized protein MCAP_0864-like [Mya arenaria]|uniref:uncharacterized protein MCAP_0864-like n=1 Tax=Mya arenaria TaxID=6604 RepID=UPI0022DEFEDA|nr:uncharacterized protein MCAP_0864-like [Mya arenaria]